jgi:hypothetical protein
MCRSVLEGRPGKTGERMAVAGRQPMAAGKGEVEREALLARREALGRREREERQGLGEQQGPGERRDRQGWPERGARGEPKPVRLGNAR